MSVFKRLSNVAKGKIKELGKNLSELDPFGEGGPEGDDPELDPSRPPPRRDAAPQAAGPSKASKRAMLDKLKADGLLTDEEYEAKIALLEGDETPGPRKPMKRTL